jgi:hypothetical protein
MRALCVGPAILAMYAAMAPANAQRSGALLPDYVQFSITAPPASLGLDPIGDEDVDEHRSTVHETTSVPRHTGRVIGGRGDGAGAREASRAREGETDEDHSARHGHAGTVAHIDRAQATSSMSATISSSWIMVPARISVCWKSGHRAVDVNHAFFTHLHYDHCMDYARLVLQRWDQGADKIPDLQVYGRRRSPA